MQVMYPEGTTPKGIHPVGVFCEGWAVWRRCAGLLSKLYLLIFAPVYIVTIIISFMLPAKIETPAQITLTVISALLVMLVGIWGGVAMILAVVKNMTGSENSVGANISEAKGYFFRYLITTILYTLILVLVILLGTFIAGSIGGALGKNTASGVTTIVLIVITLLAAAYFFIRLFLCGTVCVLENIGPIAALKHANALVKKHMALVIGVMLLVFLTLVLVGAPMWGLAAVYKNSDSVDTVSQVYQFITNIVFMPVWTAIMVILCNKLKEANA